eukprot:g8864.t1
MTAKWRFLYFDASMRGEQVRRLFRIARVPFEDVRFPYPAGLKQYKSAALGDASPLAWDQCPTVMHDGSDSAAFDESGSFNLSQVAAIMQYLGRKFDMAPDYNSNKRCFGTRRTGLRP